MQGMTKNKKTDAKTMNAQLREVEDDNKIQSLCSQKVNHLLSTENLAGVTAVLCVPSIHWWQNTDSDCPRHHRGRETREKSGLRKN